eukprot:182366_1
MVKLWNDCWITFEHPVLLNVKQDMNAYKSLHTLDTNEIHKFGLSWVLPKDILPIEWRYQETIYNFILDSYHTINVGGNWCCTLGHNYKGHVIQHEFWGNSFAIESLLKSKYNTYPHIML